MNNTTMVEEIISSVGSIDFIDRNLAGDGLSIDYTVFAMAVVTMGLLLIVAIIRHKIDHMARGKEYFENVLEAVYHELSTLGIVEATVFVIHHYFKINVAVELVFAEVHFTLFFVAIINAIMNSLLYFFSHQVAYRQWVRMEAIDLDHYVAIRKQFDAIQGQLELTKEENRRKISKDSSSRQLAKSQRRRLVKFEAHLNDNCEVETDAPSNIQPSMTESTTLGTRLSILKSKLKKRMDWKYRQLLVQVKFHELRVHFIEVNNLDPKFKVSDYLKVCMNDVFNEQVEISTTSWLVLLGGTLTIYFCMGVIAAQEKSQESVGVALSWIYMGYIVAFVFFSFWISFVMKKIFFKIMEHQKWVKKDNGPSNQMKRQQSIASFLSSFSSLGNRSENDVRQIDYFPGGDPTYIVVAAQAMQFGYALAFAILLVFNKTIKKFDSPFGGFEAFLLVPLFCYALFLWLWSTIIPQYTQCTSLGELVSTSNLRNAEAMFQLREAKRRRQQEIDNAENEKLIEKNMEVRTTKPVKKIDEGERKMTFLSKMLPGVDLIGKSKKRQELSYLDLSGSDNSLSASQRLEKLSELVKKSSEDLPEVRPRRRPRRKTVSDGVASMRLFSTTSSVASEALMGNDVEEKSVDLLPPQPAPTLRTRPRRQKALSTGVFFMQSEKPKPFIFDNKNEDSKKMRPLQVTKNDAEDHENLEKTADNSGINAPRLDSSLLAKEPFQQKQMTRNNFYESFEAMSKDESYEAMPKSLQQKKFILPIHEECEEEESCEESQVNLSDIDDTSEGIPDISDAGNSVDVIKVNKDPVTVRLCIFFQTRKWKRFSALCGTFFILFLIAMRIEIILIDTCSIKDNLNTWDFFTRRNAFWTIIIWLCILLLQSLFVTILFLKTGRSSRMVIAGCFDFTLCGICLAIFLVAEFQRCCDSDCNDTTSYSRYLASSDTSYEYKSCPSDKTDLCCPTFGTRLCAGVGTIEPFTAIIIFRSLRYIFAKKVHKLCSPAQTPPPPPGSEDDDIEPHGKLGSLEGITSSLNDDRKIKIHTSCDFEHDVGTISQLWTMALSKYPEIAEEHGIYSGLLLEAMLGIAAKPEIVEQSESNEAKTPKMLPPDTPSSLRAFTRKHISSLSEAGSATIERNDDNGHNFVRPASALIRNMRRCQCKWLPLLDEWEVVDVVLTKYELVWFGPQSLGGIWDDQIEKKTDEMERALRENKGGRGMRLCDVAVGRELLGRLPLTDIDQIKVQRLPSHGRSSRKPPLRAKSFLRGKKKRDVENGADEENFSTEFWSKQRHNQNGDRVQVGTAEFRWHEVMEDALVAHTPQGTLHLRFLVDLIDEESKDPTETRDIHDLQQKKKGAILWCQTMSHICGASQLKKQKLPHFGEADELLDFVEIL